MSFIASPRITHYSSGSSQIGDETAVNIPIINIIKEHGHLTEQEKATLLKAHRIVPRGTFEHTVEIEFPGGNDTLELTNIAANQDKPEDMKIEEEDPVGEPGSYLKVKRIDEVFDRKRHEWLTKDTVTSPNKDKKEKYAVYAFTVNRKFHPTPDPTLHRITVSLDIRSHSIKKAGAEIIGSSLGVSWTSKPLKIDPQVFLAFMKPLQAYIDTIKAKPEKTPEEELVVEHTEFLLNYLREEHQETLEELDSLLTHNEITFDLLWALLTSRSIIYTPCPVTGAPRAVRLINAEIAMRNDGSKFWCIKAEYVEWNSTAQGAAAAVAGEKFGVANLTDLEIPYFKGAAKITSLPVYPLVYYNGVEELKERLIERGKKWITMEGVHHMYYDGTAYHFKEGKHIKMNIGSRIMIDWLTFQQMCPNYTLPTVVRTLSGANVDKHLRKQAIVVAKSAEAQVLTDDDLLLTSPIIYGFSLSDKVWMEFDVDHISTFTWNDEAFGNLVLPRDQKSIIKSLVEAHSAGLSNFDDFVEGKGKGLIINLFGNPGVGKSLTAEATSEHVRKPLYIVGAGDLGSTAAALDGNLNTVFNMCANWGAVALIDEADVFLEERSFHNLERNAMVAVFLRQLEYFRGILFLTTNRVRTFDEAFQSRIHVALHYQDLTPDAKRQIWVAFVQKAKSTKLVLNNNSTNLNITTNGMKASSQIANAGLSFDQLHDLGERKVNGRQIKNVVRTATALAFSANEEIGYKHLVQVLDMMEQFDASNTMYQ